MRCGLLQLVACTLAGATPGEAGVVNLESTYAPEDGLYTYTFFAGTLPFLFGNGAVYLNVQNVETVYLPEDWSADISENTVLFTYEGDDVVEVEGQSFHLFAREPVTFAFRCAHSPEDFSALVPPQGKNPWLGGMVFGTVLPADGELVRFNPQSSLLVGVHSFELGSQIEQLRPFSANHNPEIYDVEIPHRELPSTVEVVDETLRLTVSGMAPDCTYGVLRRDQHAQDWSLVDTIYTFEEEGSVTFETLLSDGEGLYRVLGWK